MYSYPRGSDNLALLLEIIRTIFFFFLLSYQVEERILSITFGSILGPNFYMGMQNLSRLEFRFLISFKLRLHPLVFMQTYVLRPCATGNTGHAGAHITLTTFTRFAHSSSVGSKLALYGSNMHVATL